MRYEIKGDTLPVLICHLEEGEQMVTEGGSMAWMTPNISLQTSSRGGMGKAFGRVLSGESLFQNIYTSKGGPGTIAFASNFPGAIKMFEIKEGQELIAQKSAFLAGEKSVECSVFFNKKFASGFFGGEGFIMQKFSGHGLLFAEFDGHIEEIELAKGEKLIVDTGHLAAMSATCSMEIVQVPGVKSVLFAGEGLFNTEITGPGRVYLQTMPISNVAGALRPYFPTSSR